MTSHQPMPYDTAVPDEPAPTEVPVQMHIRPATSHDNGALQAMHKVSLRDLGQTHYSAEQIEGFLADVDTSDQAMLEDGTFWLIEDGDRVVASGGWTLRPPAYAGRAQEVPQTPGVATIRGVFVLPSHTRRGLASAIMAACEDEATQRGGATEIQLYSTLPGVPLYLELGYAPGPLIEIPLSNGAVFVACKMTKSVGARGQPG